VPGELRACCSFTGSLETDEHDDIGATFLRLKWFTVWVDEFDEFIKNSLTEEDQDLSSKPGGGDKYLLYQPFLVDVRIEFFKIYYVLDRFSEVADKLDVYLCTKSTTTKTKVATGLQTSASIKAEQISLSIPSKT